MPRGYQRSMQTGIDTLDADTQGLPEVHAERVHGLHGQMSGLLMHSHSHRLLVYGHHRANVCVHVSLSAEFLCQRA
jgi:hypothetical protein